MARTVTVRGSNIKHLLVSTDKHKSPLCGAVREMSDTYGRRRLGGGDVTCNNCKRVLKQAVANVLA